MHLLKNSFIHIYVIVSEKDFENPKSLLILQVRTTGKKCSILKSYETYEQYSQVLESHLIFGVAVKVKKGLANIDKHST